VYGVRKGERNENENIKNLKLKNIKAIPALRGIYIWCPFRGNKEFFLAAMGNSPKKTRFMLS